MCIANVNEVTVAGVIVPSCPMNLEKGNGEMAGCVGKDGII